MATAFVQSKAASIAFEAQTAPVTFDNPVSAGSTIVVLISQNSNTAVDSVVDDGGNSYVQRESVAAFHVWTGKIVTGGSSFTVTASTSANNGLRRVQILEYSNGDYDVSTVAEASTDSPASGSVTPTQDGSAIVGLLGADSTGDITEGAGFTLREKQVNVASAGAASEDLIQTTAAAIEATFTLAASATWRCAVIALSPAAEPPAAQTPIFFGRMGVR